ncbi:MAG: FprA family A-type flavoprotein [Rikenellaceae bacterium]
MFTNTKISETLYHIGVNDRKKALFENLWPLPNGVSYNSYVIKDDKCALFDTVENGSDLDFISRVESVLDGRELDYLVINHMEPDHSGAIKDVVRRWKDVKVVGNAKTYKVLQAYFGEVANLCEVKDGDEISLGHHNIKFVFTPWVHWPETMMSYDTTDKILFSGDAFGTFGTLDGGVFDDEVNFDYYESDMRRYYSNIVGKYSNMTQKAIQKLSSTEVKVICPLHGIVWRENPVKVISLYDKWSKYEADQAVVIIFSSMYGSTESMADSIARSISLQGVKDIRVFDASKTHLSYLINEIWRCRGVVLGSCAYNGEMHPTMHALTTELLHMGVKNKQLAIFGTYSWNGGGVRNLKKFAEEIGWNMVSEPIDILGRPTAEKLSGVETLAIDIAKAIK